MLKHVTLPSKNHCGYGLGTEEKAIAAAATAAARWPIADAFFTAPDVIF